MLQKRVSTVNKMLMNFENPYIENVSDWLMFGLESFPFAKPLKNIVTTLLFSHNKNHNLKTIVTITCVVGLFDP